ncbi:MAG: ABC transporter permease subunit [Anaerolineales bacterium]|nr:ABC transporter permease subunit [Anaerolineales bacterium]
MLRFLARRILFIIMVCVLIIFFVHLGMRMAVNSTGAGVSLDLARDTSLAWTDTIAYIGAALQGQLGFVISEHGFPILIRDILRESYINSMGLLLFALTGAALIGVPTGGFLSLTRHKVLVLPILTLTLIGISLPSFFIGILLQQGEILFLRTFGHRLVNIIGFGWDFEHMLLPVLVLSARPLAYLSRASYISLSRIIEQDFIRTAYAKGLSRMRTVNIHAFKNMAVPVLTAIGVSLRFSLGSLPVVELLFHWPGIGLNLLRAINAHQTALVATLALALGVTFLVFNLILDVAFRIIDPRLEDLK